MISFAMSRSGQVRSAPPSPVSGGSLWQWCCKYTAALALTCLLPNTAMGQYTTVPLDHQVYPFLQKAEVLQLFSSYALRVLPLERAAVLSLLQEIKHKDDVLSAADRRLLQQMLGEFHDPDIGTAMPRGGEIHAYRYEEGDAQIFIDLRGSQVFRFSRNRLFHDDEDISETTAQGAIRARFGEHLYLGMQAHNSMILGQEDAVEIFDPSQGQIQVTSGAAAFSDQAIGYAVLRTGRLRALLGRNWLGWGNDLQEQLSLSGANEPLDQIRLMLDFSRFRFTYFHANLQGIARQRFLAGHRLDIMPWRRLQVGLYETIVYGGRGAEWGYLNPVVPYQIIEHHLGDKDNNVFGFDVIYFPQPGVKLSAEIFIDDLSLERSLATYWGNKLAYHAGAHWAQPFGVRTLEASIYYTRVDPFVYTHFDSLNVYAHYGESLGTRLGPNADRIRLRLAWQPLRDTRWEITYSFVRQGGGNLLRPHRPEDGDRKGFLAGPLEKRHDFSLRLRQQVRRDVFAGFDLLLRNRLNAGRVQGRDQLERFARFFMEVNY